MYLFIPLFIYSSAAYVSVLLVAETKQCSVTGRSNNSELEGIWKDTFVVRGVI
jgi:hypothetical protein